MNQANPAGDAHTLPPDSLPAGPRSWWQTDWFFVAATVLVTLGIAWGMARHELVSRARHAYLEGEKYYSWYQDPGKKKAYYDGEVTARRVTPDQYTLLMQDNDLKNAYTWYQTVLELFQPPRSEWVIKSEERMKEVKPKYDAWLRTMGVDPVE